MSGLFLLCAILIASTWSSTAAAESLTLEVARSTAGFDQRTNQPIVTIAFAEASKSVLTKFMADKIGRTIELRLDGQVLVKSVVREPILGGSLQISGTFSIEETRAIAGRLSAGSKVEVEAVEK